MINLVDYHCHLDLYPDFENIINECENNRIYTLAVTTTPKAWPKNYELTFNKNFVRAALGFHPQLVNERAIEIELFENYFSDTNYIGEIGLDAGPAFYKSFDLQIKIFGQIINLCSKSGGKILSVHSIRSVPQVLEIIKKNKAEENNKIILHWYSGSISNAKKAVEMGCYFSVNSQMLLSQSSRELVKSLPLNRILTETDGPFTTINQFPQKPKDVTKCLQSLSGILNFQISDLTQTILNNMLELETLTF